MTVVDFSFQSESWLDDSFTAASFHRKSRKQNGDFRFPVQTKEVFVPFFSYFLLKPEKIQRTCRLFQLHAVVLICGGVGDKTVFCIYDGNKLL